MDWKQIDFSLSYEEIFAQIRARERQLILKDIERLDAITEQLEAEDLFNHAEFKKLRRRIGSQQDWADVVGVSAATIGNYERSQTYPNKSTRKSIIVALKNFRKQLEENLDTGNVPFAKKDEKLDVDIKEAKTTLDKSILDASLTDFKFDSENQKVIPVAFEFDEIKTEIAQIEQARSDLIEALGHQADRIAKNLSDGVNANVNRIVQALHDYQGETRRTRPNPRILLRAGNLISRSASNDDISFAISDFDQAALDEFSDDHRELMRLYYREALAKAQRVSDIEIDPDDAVDIDKDFDAVADELDKVRTQDGEPVFSEAITTLLRDISAEIREYKETEILTSDAERKSVIKKRRGEAIKNGSILVGRILIFVSFVTIVDPMVALTTAGSIASIVSVIQNESPGTVRRYYEKLREKLPFLPRYPSKK
ncbi:hypothetical protein KUH32_01795 [Thalassococcus sp. CAU 1522]|uniref:HTH cro/C1-type domain-containing protein n=1 Tax=Thalassococcus arenae TaxID=2851652 RepID=A0ABS6N390_9RHOB|nr:hypothetical protein [Thalassococcus arenae]MBV2358495.1 hypothetical protein [Thalassococcus arenae]